jgi:hypothetical protein
MDCTFVQVSFSDFLLMLENPASVLAVRDFGEGLALLDLHRHVTVNDQALCEPRVDPGTCLASSPHRRRGRPRSLGRSAKKTEK